MINLLIGCSSGSIYRELFENLSILFQDPQDIPEKEFKKIIYSTKQARIGRSKNSIIVLEEMSDHDNRTIYDPSGILISGIINISSKLLKIDEHRCVRVKN